MLFMNLVTHHRYTRDTSVWEGIPSGNSPDRLSVHALHACTRVFGDVTMDTRVLIWLGSAKLVALSFPALPGTHLGG